MTVTRNLDPCADCGRVMCDCDGSMTKSNAHAGKRDELFNLILATKKPSYSGDGFWIGEAVDTILANPDVVLAALGYPEHGRADCEDPWVCCLHHLTEEERRNA